MSVFIISIPLLISLIALLFNKNNKNIIKLSILAMGLLLLIRYGVGYDYFNYTYITENNLSFNFSYLGDVLNRIANILDFPNGFMGLAAVIQSIILMMVFNTDRKYATIIFFSLPFFYIDSFTIVRQALGVSIILLSIKFLREEKTNLGFILYIVASLIHATCMVALPIYYSLQKYNFTYKSALKFILISLFGVIILYWLVNAVYVIDSELKLLVQYQAYDQEGMFYIIIGSVLLIGSVLSGNKECIKICFVALLMAIFVNFFLGYVFNRMLVFFYIPLLFVDLNFNNQIKLITFLATIVLVYAMTIYVKIGEPLNGFQEYQTIF